MGNPVSFLKLDNVNPEKDVLWKAFRVSSLDEYGQIESLPCGQKMTTDESNLFKTMVSEGRTIFKAKNHTFVCCALTQQKDYVKKVFPERNMVGYI